MKKQSPKYGWIYQSYGEYQQNRAAMHSMTLKARIPQQLA